VVKHEVKVEEQTLELYNLREGEVAKNMVNPIEFQDCGFPKALDSHLPVIVFVETSVPSLEKTTILLDGEINSPHLFSHDDFISSEVWVVVDIPWLAVNPLFLLLFVVGFLLLFVVILRIVIISPLFLG
jgi:hypothetical protein